MARAAFDNLRLQQTRDTVLHAPQPLPARGDPRLLQLVLDNLVGNAWKFSVRQRHAQITVGSEAGKDGETVFFVRDNGVGFEMDYAGKLFGAFQRMHSQAEFPGTGVGLANVWRIVTRHGGRIWARAAPGQGATFYFTLGELPAS
jgi:light-regulated signal transduction histidine kinase (bacteriophytochrome)